MDCIIIEDEKHAIQHLENQLAATGQDIPVKARLRSVEEAVSWLQEHTTDLIFMDIQLDDGISFEIFDHIQIKTPVIFTTAYDQYITRAFDVNSIAYILKPVKLDKLKTVIDKYKFLYSSNHSINENMLNLSHTYQQRFLVRNGNAVKPVEIEDVACFYVREKHFIFLVTKDKQQHLYDSTLEILEKRLNPKNFFRISRQYIINIDIIKNVTAYGNSRLLIKTHPDFKNEIIVSRYRADEFRSWLNR